MAVVCITLLPLLGAVPTRAETLSNQKWKNFVYSLTDNQITITGLKEGTTGAVTIPSRINGSPVVAIQNYAFEHEDGITSLNTGDSVTTIGKYAFEYCSKLTEVTIGKSVKQIGDFAFKDCPKLSKITVADANTMFSSASGILYSKKKTELIKVPAGYRSHITVPDTVTKIRGYAFEFCKQLTGVTIGSGVTTIGAYAFRNCSAMKTLTIGNHVQSIGQEAFSSCSSLTAIHIPSSVTYIGVEAFHYCDDVTELTIGDGLRTIPEGAFDNFHSLKKLTIGKNVTSIAKRAFYRCESLEEVTFPDSVSLIDTEAFMYSDNLSKVTFGTGLRTLGEGVFLGSSVEQVTFTGPAPAFHADALCGVSGVARYPYPDDSWTADVRQDYGGEVTWESYIDRSKFAAVQGTVSSAGSDPVTLSLWKTGATDADYRETFENGEYSMEMILPGAYTIRATKKNHVPLEYTITPTAGETLIRDFALRLLGDVNGDGQIKVTDVAVLYAHIRNTTPITDAYTLQCCDCNGDGKINIIDVGLLYAHIKNVSSIHK